MRRFSIYAVILFSFLFILFYLQLAACSSEEKVNASLSHVNQNAMHYAKLPNAHYQIDPLVQKNLAQQFLRHYFSPWHAADLAQLYEKNADILAEQNTMAKLYTHEPGWGANLRPHDHPWIQAITANMQLASFPNDEQPGIVTQATDVRVLPTHDPSYESRDQPGHSYPFDELQESYLSANTPVRILHKSQDGAWLLLATSSYAGWVPANTVALVSPAFIQHWQSSAVVTVKKDHLPITTQEGQWLEEARLGVLYPAIHDPQQGNLIETAFRLPNAQAITVKATLDPKQQLNFPLTFTPQQFAQLANTLIGNPYGWGGALGYRDCSATLQDLFTAFGIWLPRSSVDQAKMGEVIPLQQLSSQKKLATIQQQAIPFLTLVHQPGHIMLYLGEDQGTSYVFQAPWGLRTTRWFQPSGRLVIGRTVIIPLRFAQNYWDIAATWLGKTDSITRLLPHNALK